MFDSFQYFWQDCDIFEGQLINENVLGKFHRDHDHYAPRPLELTNQGSAKPYLKPATPMLVTETLSDGDNSKMLVTSRQPHFS